VNPPSELQGVLSLKLFKYWGIFYEVVVQGCDLVKGKVCFCALLILVAVLSLEGVINAFLSCYPLNGCLEVQVIELLDDLDRIT